MIKGSNNKTNLIFYQKLSELLNFNQKQLRENFTYKIDRMIQNFPSFDAFGSNIYVFRFGGTKFVIMPKNENPLILAVKEASGEACLIHKSNGVELF